MCNKSIGYIIYENNKWSQIPLKFKTRSGTLKFIDTMGDFDTHTELFLDEYDIFTVASNNNDASECPLVLVYNNSSLSLQHYICEFF